MDDVATATRAQATTRRPLQELVVISHVRWDQAPSSMREIVVRLGRDVPTWFLEPPSATPELAVGERITRTLRDGAVTRVWTEVPGATRALTLDAREVGLQDEVVDLLGTVPGRVLWMSTPVALDLAERLAPDLLVYDVIDGHAAAEPATSEVRLRHHAAIRRCGVVFTATRSLHDRVTFLRSERLHCFLREADSGEHVLARVGHASGLGPEPAWEPIATAMREIVEGLLGASQVRASAFGRQLAATSSP